MNTNSLTPNLLKVSSTCQIPKLADIYANFFTTSGTFVEVGANDGELASNTSCLADLGWNGVYIEPDVDLARKCAERNASNKVNVYCYAASDKEENIILHRFDGGLGTASSETLLAHSNIPWARDVKGLGATQVAAVTLNQILAAACIEPRFELLVVDVEGFEEKVFAGFDLYRYKPKMIIVELCDYHPSFLPYPSLQASAMRVRERILGANYRQFYSDPINSIFVYE